MALKFFIPPAFLFMQRHHVFSIHNCHSRVPVLASYRLAGPGKRDTPSEAQEPASENVVICLMLFQNPFFVSRASCPRNWGIHFPCHSERSEESRSSYMSDLSFSRTLNFKFQILIAAFRSAAKIPGCCLHGKEQGTHPHSFKIFLSALWTFGSTRSPSMVKIEEDLHP
jgi:hypothetical protein